MKQYEIIPHTADLKIRVYGKSIQELFTHSLVGMFQVLQPKAQNCNYNNDRIECSSLPIIHEIEIISHDYTMLLVDFLSQALYLSDANNEAYFQLTIIKLTPTLLLAKLHGVSIQGFEGPEIKAVTYHDLDVVQQDGVFQTDIVFDI